MSDTTRRVFFVHLQKTAGTSLVHRLRRRNDPSIVYPDESDGAPADPDSVISVDHLCRRWPQRREQVRVLAGHFPLCTRDVLGEDFDTATTLRDPVERTLSYLRHYRKLVPEAADEPLESLYEDPERYRSFIHNHMVKMLSLTAEEMTDGALTPVDFDQSHLDRAKTNLATFDVIGLTDRYDEFWDEVKERFGWDLGKKPGHTNRTEPVPVADAFRRRIAEDNHLDMELFEFARQIVADRRRQPVS